MLPPKASTAQASREAGRSSGRMPIAHALPRSREVYDRRSYKTQPKQLARIQPGPQSLQIRLKLL